MSAMLRAWLILGAVAVLLAACGGAVSEYQPQSASSFDGFVEHSHGHP